MESHRCWLCLLSGDCEGLFGVLNTQVMPFAVRLKEERRGKERGEHRKMGCKMLDGVPFKPSQDLAL